jgi:hypothetical protein
MAEPAKRHFRISAVGANGIEDWTEAFVDEAAARAALAARGFEPRLLEPLGYDPYASVPIRPLSEAEHALRTAKDEEEIEAARRRRRGDREGLLGDLFDGDGDA